MANPSSDSTFPWMNLAALLVVITGAISWFLDPISSSRPPQKGEEVNKVETLQDVEARLWEDPIGAAVAVYRSEKKGLKEAELREMYAPKLRMLQEAVDGNDSLLLMPVFIPSGSSADQAEFRRRMRHAVLSGLAVSGFAPSSGDRIGFFRPVDVGSKEPGFRATWDMQAGGSDDSLAPFGWFGPQGWAPKRGPVAETSSDARIQSGVMPEIVPFEMFRLLGGNANYVKAGWTNVLVCWLEGDLPDLPHQPNWRSPIHQIALLRTIFDRNPPKKGLEVKVLGPTFSGDLLNMYKELVSVAHGEPAGAPLVDLKRWIEGTTFYAATPTVTEEYFGLFLQPPDKKETAADVLLQLAKKNPLGLELKRTIANDEQTATAIVEELKWRDVHVVESKGQRDHIALLTEWDTFYGRTLPYTFSKLVTGKGVVETLGRVRNSEEKLFGDTIHYYSYQRGIDGRKPGDSAEQKSDKTGDAKKPPQEATEGDNQSDYLRRQAAELKRLDDDLRSRGEGGLKAVGVLGSDVYDVLMVLRALRKVLPDAIFFTNSYDARLGLHEEWSATRNLVIVSPYGPMLADRWQRYIPPFRDGYQTAYFAATMAAAGYLKAETCYNQRPQVFEVGRSGLVALSDGKPLPSSEERAKWDGLKPPPPGLPVDLLQRPLMWGLVCVVLIGLVLYRAREQYRLLIYEEEDNKQSKSQEGRFGRSFCRQSECLWKEAARDSWLIAAVIVAFSFFAVCIVARAVPTEPLLFFSGVSVWPTQIVRLVAGLLSCYYLFKGHHDLMENQEEIGKRFALDHKPAVDAAEKGFWRRLQQRMEQAYYPWKESTLSNGKQPGVKGYVLWQQYVQAGSTSARIIRSVSYGIAYLAFCSLLVAVWGLPKIPARGAWAFGWDGVFLAFGVLMSVGLVMYVYDATSLHCDFIRMLNQGRSEWPPEVKRQFARSPTMGTSVREFIDIRLIAERSDVVSGLIYYPFIVVLLMIAARTAYFDDWTWPPSLVLIFTANLMISTYNALRLYKWAMEAKSQALGVLRHDRNQKAAAAGQTSRKVGVFDETIAEIEKLKQGAFAPFWEQPVVRSILYSSGGLGLGSLIQTLPQFF